MRNVLRLAVMATLLLATGAIRADDGSAAASATQAGTESATTATSDAAMAKTAPAAERGAPGMEPVEAIDEDPGTGNHHDWVVSIWTSP